MTACMRDSFYVGGHYVEVDSGKHTMQGQMYVECLRIAREEPTGHESYPIVLVHGGTRTGA